MGFSEIIGQTRIVESLKNALINDRISHGYIFNGPSGIGKKTVAKAFCSLLLCSKASENLDRLMDKGADALKPCGECPGCRLYENGANPDFSVIEAEGGSIGVDEIRKIQSEIMIRPLYAKRKVYLIIDGDKMTVQAQNCLLKTLEEPPAYAVLILTVSNLNNILETIRSRAVKLNFKKNTSAEIRGILTEKLGGDIENLGFITSYSDGIPGIALEMAQSREFGDLRQEIINIALMLPGGEITSFFQSVKFFDDNKEHIDAMLDVLLLLYRDLLVAAGLKGEYMLINSDKKDIILNNAPKFSIVRLLENIEYILETRKYIKQNANYQLAVEVMLMKLREE